jgi:hypothetical protein
LFEVYFGDPELQNFSAASDSDDFWVLDGVSGEMYTESWSTSREALLLSKLLDGPRMPIYWGKISFYGKIEISL